MKDSPDCRRRHLAAIHAKKHRLNLTDEAYRNLLYCLTGKRSSGNMTITERATVIEFMKRQQPASGAQAPAVTCSDEEAAAILGIAA